MAGAGTVAEKAGKTVLFTLCMSQFLMTLDSSVMNVSIAYVANDVGATVTGVQTAITLYTLVMATLMITGGKIGAIIGRRRAFSIGCVVYGAGSLTTALAPNLGILILGWSCLEGIGAALIMPALVALVASNFPPQRRSAAYGLIAAAGAMAVAAGPLIGGAVTTYASWRWVFAGEVVIVILILALARKVKDTEVVAPPQLDLLGSALSIVGLGAVVFGVLKSGEWGWVKAKPEGPDVLGVSPVIWLLLGGLLVIYVFFLWERRLESRMAGARLGAADATAGAAASGEASEAAASISPAGPPVDATGATKKRRSRPLEPLVRPSMFRNRQLDGGLLMFLMQYLVQAGAFFVIPLFLSVVLALSALQTGLRLLPLSIALLISAAGIPKLFPKVSPRRVVRIGLLLILLGLVVVIGGIDLDADAAVVAVPLLLIGLGIGALASQLGAVTVSAVPDEQSAEVGGLQNTALNLGASLGTALAGAVLISSLTAAFLSGVAQSPDIPQEVKDTASVQLAAGVPFVSDADLQKGLEEAGVDQATADDIMEANTSARIAALDAALAVVAIMAVVALFFTGMAPTRPPGAGPAPAAAAEPPPEPA
jgi:MFS family permease